MRRPSTPGSVCPACDAGKAPGQYLCAGCWFTLPSPARKALNRRDGMPAVRRLSDLLKQIRDDVPLHTIAISR